MNRRTKILIAAIAATALVLAWLAGYFAGTSRQSATTAAGKTPEEIAGALRADDPARIGVPVPADGTGILENGQHTPWTRARLERAIGSVATDPSPFRAMRTALRVSEAMSEEDFPGVLDESRDLFEGGELAEICKVAIMARWMELNPRAAGDYLAKNKELGGFIDIPGEFLAGVWAGSDPSEGVRWARESGNTDYAEKIVKALARRDPDEARAFAEANLPEKTPEQIAGMIDDDIWRAGTPEEAARRLGALPGSRNLRQVAERWAKEDPAQSLEWAAALPDGNSRRSAIDGVISSWAEKEPAAAATWLLKQGGTDIAGLISKTVNEWVKKDVTGAKNWAADLPDAGNRKDAFEAIAGNLVETAPKDCAAWLESVPPSPERDTAVGRFADGIVRKEPLVAMDWALTVSDPVQRGILLRDLTGTWFQSDPGAAFSWLQDSPQLTDEDRQAILKPR